MSAKRPRPAIPVLVHVDNPTEAASVVVDTSTIEGKMDTVITNQNRIYDKIPTSTGGSSADLTTVNANTTALSGAIGSVDSTYEDNDLIGLVKNLRGAIGVLGVGIPTTENTVRSLLYNMRNAIGSVSYEPTTTGSSVRDLLAAIKQNTASGGGGGGGGGSADLTTVNNKITALAETIGPVNSTYEDNNLIGRIKNLALSAGEFGGSLSITGTGLRSLLYNVREGIGDYSSSINEKGTSVRSLLYNVREGIGDYSVGVNAKGTTVRSSLYNIRNAIGDSLDTPTATGTTVRDLLTAIKENTASGGSGGSADLTTVNEKTTALAAAIGSASDDSSTVSVIGLLKSITDKY